MGWNPILNPIYNLKSATERDAKTLHDSPPRRTRTTRRPFFRKTFTAPCPPFLRGGDFVLSAVVRIPAILAVLVASVSCGFGAGGLFQQYEYEEELYLSLDGTATTYVNASVAALDALRGASLDASPAAQVDREKVRAFF